MQTANVVGNPVSRFLPSWGTSFPSLFLLCLFKLNIYCILKKNELSVQDNKGFI